MLPKETQKQNLDNEISLIKQEIELLEQYREYLDTNEFKGKDHFLNRLESLGLEREITAKLQQLDYLIIRVNERKDESKNYSKSDLAKMTGDANVLINKTKSKVMKKRLSLIVRSYKETYNSDEFQAYCDALQKEIQLCESTLK